MSPNLVLFESFEKKARNISLRFLAFKIHQPGPMRILMEIRVNNRQLKLGLATFVALSLFVHFLFVAGLSIVSNRPPEIVPLQFEMVEETEQKSMPKMENLVKDEAKQIVDQDEKALNKEIDEKAKFLSRNNQKVEKQTVTKNRGEFQNRATRSSTPGTGGQKQLSVLDLAPKFDVVKAVQDKQKAEQKFEEDPNGYQLQKAATAQKPVPKPLPQPQATQPGETGQQASQTVDYIKDLDPGLETLLSTREFVYYTYYARIRRQLNQFWGPKVREKLVALYRSGRQIASSTDKITKCLVTLNKDGKLMRVQIIGNSGVHELDEAAVEAFKLAEPFPNPPHGMVEDDGSIRIRWDFILEV